MRVIAAYRTNVHPYGGIAPERYLVLEDGRGVYIDPLDEDRIDDDAKIGLATLRGTPQLDAAMLELWSAGYPVLSLADRDRLVEMLDRLEDCDALGWIQVVPGPDYDACVPEGYVRLLDSVGKGFVTLPWATALEAVGRAAAVGGPSLRELAIFVREPDGAALWFAHEHDARRIYAGRTVLFHPVHGLVRPGEHEAEGWPIETFTVKQAVA
jgi:hypothetical protein